MDSLINAGKEYLTEQLSGSGSGSHQGKCRSPITVVIAIINRHSPSTQSNALTTYYIDALEAN